MKPNVSQLEHRMYGFVPYALIGIQKGIQFGHAVVEYADSYFDTPEYVRWSKQDKTFIILNGGTMNEETGTMEQHLEELGELGVRYETFYEPDLNKGLSGIVFLVDERVYDWKKHPMPGHKEPITSFGQYNRLSQEERDKVYQHAVDFKCDWFHTLRVFLAGFQKA